MILTVQMMIGSVETDLRNGSVEKRYHGYTTGAHRSDAAIGQANASGDGSGHLLLSQVALSNPTSTASPATICGGVTSSKPRNTGSLKRKLLTNVPSDPVGVPWLRNGTYRSPITATASTASRVRTRFQ